MRNLWIAGLAVALAAAPRAVSAADDMWKTLQSLGKSPSEIAAEEEGTAPDAATHTKRRKPPRGAKFMTPEDVDRQISGGAGNADLPDPWGGRPPQMVQPAIPEQPLQNVPGLTEVTKCYAQNMRYHDELLERALLRHGDGLPVSERSVLERRIETAKTEPGGLAMVAAEMLTGEERMDISQQVAKHAEEVDKECQEHPGDSTSYSYP